MATYTKLKSGDWGIRIEGGSAPTAGTKITVRKKSGETKTETIAKVVWSGNGIHLCAIATENKPARQFYSGLSGGGSRRRRTGCSCGSIEDEVNDGDCFSCRHDQE